MIKANKDLEVLVTHLTVLTWNSNGGTEDCYEYPPERKYTYCSKSLALIKDTQLYGWQLRILCLTNKALHVTSIGYQTTIKLHRSRQTRYLHCQHTSGTYAATSTTIRFAIFGLPAYLKTHGLKYAKL
jgi:hypothetical protein